MTGFIRELYYGNIDPQARCIRRGSNADKASALLSKNERILLERLSGEDTQLFLDYVSAQSEMLSICQEDAFTTGFRLGAQLTCDTFVGSDTPFFDYINDAE